MIRKIIKIDETKCTGCGICADACHEGAIGMVAGKAKLLREDYCDGLGDCLPACPTGAITFEEREALAYDEAAVNVAKANKISKTTSQSSAVQTHNVADNVKNPLPCGCPGSNSKAIRREESCQVNQQATVGSRLSQWPVQIKLVPINAPYFDNADLLVAADCTAYAYGNFHNDFIKNRITIIGCPKLDMVDYTDKLTQIIANNNIKSITVVRMEVPCCGGIEYAVKNALMASGKFIPWNVVTVTTDGNILE